MVASAKSPVFVHVLVQRRWARDFQQRLRLRPGCAGALLAPSAFLRLHYLDRTLVQRSVVKVSFGSRTEERREDLSSMENFARFYLHRVLGPKLVVYLDPDTIVQADLAPLTQELLASGRTIGFVARARPKTVADFLRRPEGCSVRIQDYRSLLSRASFNVGVLAVDLRRWGEQGLVEKVEDFARQQRGCGGRLWKGGSQPPLLLAFLSRAPGAREDFIVFEPEWNAGDLGWDPGLNVSELRQKRVLHWNGPVKPWLRQGLYRELWQPYRNAFDLLAADTRAAGA